MIRDYIDSRLYYNLDLDYIDSKCFRHLITYHHETIIIMYIINDLPYIPASTGDFKRHGWNKSHCNCFLEITSLNLFKLYNILYLSNFE